MWGLLDGHIYYWDLGDEFSSDYPVLLTIREEDGDIGRLTKTDYINITCPNLPVRIGGTDYPTLQTAYNAASTGSVIQCHAVRFNEDPVFSRDIEVTFECGYNCDYSSIMGETTIEGNITVDSGTVTIKKIVLE